MFCLIKETVLLLLLTKETLWMTNIQQIQVTVLITGIGTGYMQHATDKLKLE